AEDGIRDDLVTGVKTCALPILEELRGRGVRVTRQFAEAPHPAGKTWTVAQDRPYAQVASAVQGLRRDGLILKELPACEGRAACRSEERRVGKECGVRRGRDVGR